jgi:hypothetical protein
MPLPARGRGILSTHLDDAEKEPVSRELLLRPDEGVILELQA